MSIIDLPPQGDEPTEPTTGARAVVTSVESDASPHSPPEWQITVTRLRRGTPVWSPPSAADVPADIRAGLRAWLDSAEEATR